MHCYTCNSLLNTLGRAVEQLAVCLVKQAKVSSQGQSTTVMQRETCSLSPYEYLTSVDARHLGASLSEQ